MSTTRSAAHHLFPSRPTGLADGALKKQLVARGAPADAAVLLKTEVDVIRGLIAGQQPQHLAASHGAAAAAASSSGSSPDAAARAAARKEAMRRFDEERRAGGHSDAAASIEELERAAARQQQLRDARGKQDEAIDEVKRMNQVMLYAKCVTVRDAQVLEKKALLAEKSEEERRVDMAMELERLKALRMYEERELKRVEDRKKGAAVIRAQIEEREQERLRRLELRQQEQDAMLRHIERMKDEDRAEAARKKDASRRLMEDVALANAEQIRLKNRQHELEQEEEQQIAEYIREKQARDQAALDEQLRIKAEKEKEIARLRAMQEKAQDKAAELDALRARRAQEAYEREWRAKEREAHLRQEAINADLRRAREAQRHEKEETLIEQARFEREEFDRIIAVQKVAEEQERQRQAAELERRALNATDLRKQVLEIEEGRRKTRRAHLDEGARLRTERREREATIDAIRQRKLQELERLEVPRQYRQELLKKRDQEPLRPAM